MAKKKRGKSSTVTINFKDVEIGGGGAPPDGRYRLRVDSVTQEEGKAGDYLAFTLKVTEGKQEGKTVWHNCSLSDQSLWATGSFLQALGVEIPDDEIELDLEDLVDQELDVELMSENVNGSKKSRIVDFAEAEGDAPDGDEEDDDDKKKSKKSKKSKKRDKEDEDEDADEDEDDKKSKKGKKDKKDKKKKAELTQDEINDMDQEELEELIKEHELDVDLDDFKSLKKMKAAVIDAAENAELLEEAE